VGWFKKDNISADTKMEFINIYLETIKEFILAFGPYLLVFFLTREFTQKR